MLILFAPLLLFGTALVLVVLRLIRPRFRFSWLASFVAAGVACITVLLWQWQIPISTALPGWGATIAFAAAPTYSANSLAWTYALALTGLLVASVLIAPAWPDFRNSIGSAFSLAFIALALLAVAADNVFTVVLAWAAMDLAEVALALRWAGEGDSSSGAVTTFSARLASLALVLLVQVLGGSAENSGAYDLLIVAAVALRIAVLPTRLLSSAGAYAQNSVGVAMQLASAAATLGVLSRVKLTDLASPVPQTMLLVCAGVAIYSGWMWVRASDDPTSRRFWIIGLSALAIGCTLLANPVGATAWGISLVLAGGSLFLCSAQQAWLNRAVLVGAWCLSSLPFSLSGGAWSTDAGGVYWVLPVFVVAQALLMAGFLHQATRPTRQLSLDAGPGWVRGIYIAGIGFLLLLEVALGLWGWEGAQQTRSWLAGMVATVLGLAVFWGRSRLTILDAVPRGGLQQRTVGIGSLLRRGSLSLVDAVRNVISGITSLFEGEAGIMWSLLLLALAVSLIAGRNP